MESKISKIILICLLMIAVIIICVMGISIKKLSDEKNETVEILTSQIVGLENKQSAAASTIKDTLNSLTNGDEEEDSKQIYTNKDVAGKYEMPIEEDDLTKWLYLAEDGTFELIIETNVELGNYSIEENTITLNTVFEHGSGVGLTVTKGTIKLLINEDGSLTVEEGTTYLPKSKNMKKSSENVDFDIRESIQYSIGSEDQYYVQFDY